MQVLLYGIARQRIHYDGRVIDLSADGEWRRLVTSLKRHIPLTRPPLRRDHDPRTSGALGYVFEVVGPVSRAQLIRAGVPAQQLPHGEYVMFRASLTKRGAEQYRGGDIARTSIGLGFDVVDDQGRRWPYFLEELSVVDRPHIRTQPTAQELSGVAMRAGARPLYLSSGGVINREVRMTTEERQRVTALLSELMALLGDTPGDADAMEAADEVAEEAAEDVLDTLAATEEEEATMGYEEKEEMAAALAAARSEVATLKAKLKAVELGARIDKAGMVLSAKERAELIEAGPKAVEMAIKFSAKAPTTRLAAGGLPEEPPVNRQDEINRKLLAAMSARGGEA